MLEFPLPRLPLLHAPTRLQPLPAIAAALGGQAGGGLYVKRDDEMGIAIGGNKLRSLEFWLGAARDEGADILLVGGMASSNLCRLTAAAAAISGFECLILHNSDKSDLSLRQSALSRLHGARLRFLGAMDEATRAAALNAEAAALRRAGRRPYIIGEAALGALGYALCADELLQQDRAAGAGIRQVFLPGSMGPTEAGFLFGNALLGLPYEVHLVSVEYAEDDLRARIQTIWAELCRLTGLLPALPDYRVDMRWLGAGYGAPTAAADAALMEFARCEGLLLEEVYTAKTFAAFRAHAAEAFAVAHHAGICVVHTGGVPALFAQLDGLLTRLPAALGMDTLQG
ncbi:MAG: 1-aminocyclopropane-1-carboxylate deaminase/D-cysteine desulfhydrase [Pararhodobacter sp.]